MICSSNKTIMKKIISIVLLFSLCFSFTSCGNSAEPKEISCEDIIKAYEDAGYFVSYHSHSEDSEDYYCYIIIYENEDSTSDLVEITFYNSVEGAKETAENKRYNIAIWMVSAMYGEFRWLHTGYYGDMVYSTFEYKMLKPLKELMKQGE